jgi:hypothetical protein
VSTDYLPKKEDVKLAFIDAPQRVHKGAILGATIAE